VNEIVETQTAVAVTPERLPPSPMALLQVAVDRGADITQLERLIALQERMEANEARRALNKAFSDFKAEAVRIVKNKTTDAGPLAGRKYAELFTIVNAVTPALSKHGLSVSWWITRDEKDWIEVTCTMKHTGGASESVSMGGPPDSGGAKSPIQARASTVTYLERYTLKAITGLSEQGDDDDGTDTGEGKPSHPRCLAMVADAETIDDLRRIERECKAGFYKTARDPNLFREFVFAVQTRGAELKEGAQ
jgi:ERF superfamily